MTVVSCKLHKIRLAKWWRQIKLVSVLANFSQLAKPTWLLNGCLKNEMFTFNQSNVALSSYVSTSFVANWTRWQVKTRKQLHPSSSMKFIFFGQLFSVSFSPMKKILVTCRKMQFVLHTTATQYSYEKPHCCFSLCCVWNVWHVNVIWHANSSFVILCLLFEGTLVMCWFCRKPHHTDNH